jgi:Fanconi anemia group M protein
MSQKEQRAIIEKFKAGEINSLIASSIGEEGLDLPEVSAVIFYEPIPSAIRKIQRQGRTARLAPGKLIILVTKDTRDVIHHYASSARERKMHKTIDLIKKELQEKKKTPPLTLSPYLQP